MLPDDFLKELIGGDGAIDLSTLKKIGGGGTHDIYQTDKHPELLLKIMRHTIGQDNAKMTEDVQKLNDKYSELYQIFDESRCIIEKRSIQSIKQSAHEPPQQAIVSIVPFDPSFASKEKFGFDVDPEELNEILIRYKRYLYGVANRTLLGSKEKPSPYVIRNYTLLNKSFATMFDRLGSDIGLQNAMKEFLIKYKTFYKKTDILLDTIGFDNVLFFKNDDGWQFKLGSAIKRDTGTLTKKMLDKILDNPAVVNEAVENYSSIYFMPACIRALNACAEKVGLPDKVIDDITIDERTVSALAKIHEQQGLYGRAMMCAEHGEFSKALELYHQNKQNDESIADDKTGIRDIMGVSYWKFIKNGGKETSRSEVEAYLNLLRDKRNNFPDFRKQEISEAIDGLSKKLELLDKNKYVK